MNESVRPYFRSTNAYIGGLINHLYLRMVYYQILILDWYPKSILGYGKCPNNRAQKVFNRKL